MGKPRRTLRGVAREISWLNVISVALLVFGVAVASAAIVWIQLAPLAIVLTGGSIVTAVIGLRE